MVSYTHHRMKHYMTDEMKREKTLLKYHELYKKRWSDPEKRAKILAKRKETTRLKKLGLYIPKKIGKPRGKNYIQSIKCFRPIEGFSISL
jgi:hypothetical protein